MDLEMVKSARGVFSNVGIRGGIKSVYNSLRHTGDLISIICGKNSDIEIEQGSNIEIEDIFVFGASNRKIGNPSVMGSSLYLGQNGSLKTNGLARVGGGSEFDIQGKLRIGDSYIAGHCRILCRDEITIGDGCAIAWNVDIIDSDSHHIIASGNHKSPRAAVSIGDDVWIGHNSSINKGVEIGDGAIIGSESVVCEDIPEGCLAVGNPAKVINDSVKWGNVSDWRRN